MYSDKKFGLPKDLIETVRKVVEDNKKVVTESTEKEEINEIATSVFRAAGKRIFGAAASSSLKKSGKAAPRGIPPDSPGSVVKSGGGGSPPTATTSSSVSKPSTSGSVVPKKDGALSPSNAPVYGGRLNATNSPSRTALPPPSSKPDFDSVRKSATDIKQPMSKTTTTSSSGPKDLLKGGAITTGLAGLTAGYSEYINRTYKDNKPAATETPRATPPPAPTPRAETPKAETPKAEPADDNDPAGTYDAAKEKPSVKSTPRPSAPRKAPEASAPRAKPSIERTPDLDAPTGPAGMSKRQGAEMGFSFEDGGKKKKYKTESILINAFLSLHEKKHHKKKLDPVGKEDKDIDNDGDFDSTDKYLANRRKAISKNIKEEEIVEASERLSYHRKMVKELQKELEDDPRNKHLLEKLSYHKKMVSKLTEGVEFSDTELQHIEKVLEAVSDKDEQKITGKEGSSRSKGPTIPNRDLTD